MILFASNVLLNLSSLTSWKKKKKTAFQITMSLLEEFFDDGGLRSRAQKTTDENWMKKKEAASQEKRALEYRKKKKICPWFNIKNFSGWKKAWCGFCEFPSSYPPYQERKSTKHQNYIKFSSKVYCIKKIFSSYIYFTTAAQKINSYCKTMKLSFPEIILYKKNSSRKRIIIFLYMQCMQYL